MDGMRSKDQGVGGEQKDGPLEIHFIVGVARSGTTWISRRMNEHPQAAVFGETNFYSRLYVKPNSSGRYNADELNAVFENLKGYVASEWEKNPAHHTGLIKIDPEYMLKLLDETAESLAAPLRPGEVFERLAGAVAKAENKSVVLEKTPNHLNWIDRIVENHKDARFIVTKRDPYGFTRSMKHMADWRGMGLVGFLNHVYRHPVMRALFWRGYMLSLEAAREKYPEKIVVVDLEEIIEEPEKAMMKIYDKLELAYHPVSVSEGPFNSSFDSFKTRAVAPEDVFWMNLIAGSVIKRSGYKVMKTPVSPARVLASILTIPLWLALIPLRAPSFSRGSVIGYTWNWIMERK